MVAGPFSREDGGDGFARAAAMLKAGLVGPLGGTKADSKGRGGVPLRATVRGAAPQWVEAMRAAQVAATPAGVKRMRLAMGASLGVATAAGMAGLPAQSRSPDSCRVRISSPDASELRSRSSSSRVAPVAFPSATDS